MKRLPVALVPATLLLVCAHPAWGQTTALEAIDRAVAGFAGAAIGQPGGAVLPVDRRLRLAACPADLALSWRDERHGSVVVQCPIPGGWRLFVPLRAVASGAGPAVVARGEAVTIAVAGEGFTVSQPGEAVEAGALGDWIRVRPVRDGSVRGEPMRARVTRPGEVAVMLP